MCSSSIDKLDPEREPGRLTFITRMGAGKIRDALPPLLEAVRDSDATAAVGHRPDARQRHHDPDRLQDASVRRCRGRGARLLRGAPCGRHVPGGIHVELTGDDVTECLGGSEEIDEAALATRYESLCDPRLNHMQSLELAFLVAEELEKL